MKKIILLSTVAILVLGGAAGTYWWISRPKVITFSDNTTLTLLGVDYGRRHTRPGGKLPPAPATPAAPGLPAVARRDPGSFTTPTDTLVVWLRAKYGQSYKTPDQFIYFQFIIYDKAGTACAQGYANFQPGVEVSSVQFPAFPRRQGQLYLRVQEHSISGQEMADDKFVIKNPAAGKSFEKWTPEPMPLTKEDGGLSVTLTKLVGGAALPSQRVQDDPDDVMNKGAQVTFRVERGGKPVMNWVPVSVETTDATGNRTAINYGPNGGNQTRWNGDEGTLTLHNGLWPDEPAWKLRMQFTQTSDFSTDDEWTAQNIPVVLGSQQSFDDVGRGGGSPVYSQNIVGSDGSSRRTPAGRGAAPAPVNPPPAPTPVAEADLNGHHIKVFPAVQFTNMPVPANLPPGAIFNQPQQTGLLIQIEPPLNNGMHVTLVKVADNQGGEIGTFGGGFNRFGAAFYRCIVRDTTGITNINVTIALHKDRFFEFTAKPEKADNAQP